MTDEIERHHNDQDMARLIAGLEQYLEKAVVALIVADREGKLSIMGPVELPIVRRIRNALREQGVGTMDA